MQNAFQKRTQITTKYYFHSYFDGESKLFNIGRSLFLFITNNSDLLNIKGNHHLQLKVEMITLQHLGFPLPSYDGSKSIEYDWTPPISDINSQVEWIDWLKKNQPDIVKYKQQHSISKNRDKLINLFGSDLYSEVIQKEREEKLNSLL